ncbi:MAG: hypothetical protein NTV63_01140 [Candidatus Woesearchaeota archaeon]|nr:hypothetical protein [Candidatus Woesearchaeota archaeon]
MEIRRCLRKSELSCLCLNDYCYRQGEGFRWYFGDGMIGITAIPSKGSRLNSSEYFTRGFMIQDDALIVNPLEQIILRKNESEGWISGNRELHTNVSELIEFLLSRDATYAYLTSINKSGIPGNILTFSGFPPESGLYKERRAMNVIVQYNFKDI